MGKGNEAKGDGGAKIGVGGKAHRIASRGIKCLKDTGNIQCGGIQDFLAGRMDGRSLTALTNAVGGARKNAIAADRIGMDKEVFNVSAEPEPPSDEEVRAAEIEALKQRLKELGER